MDVLILLLGTIGTGVYALYQRHERRAAQAQLTHQPTSTTDAAEHDAAA